MAAAADVVAPVGYSVGEKAMSERARGSEQHHRRSASYDRGSSGGGGGDGGDRASIAGGVHQVVNSALADPAQRRAVSTGGSRAVGKQRDQVEGDREGEAAAVRQGGDSAVGGDEGNVPLPPQQRRRRQRQASDTSVGSSAVMPEVTAAAAPTPPSQTETSPVVEAVEVGADAANVATSVIGTTSSSTGTSDGQRQHVVAEMPGDKSPAGTHSNSNTNENIDNSHQRDHDGENSRNELSSDGRTTATVPTVTPSTDGATVEEQQKHVSTPVANDSVVKGSIGAGMGSPSTDIPQPMPPGSDTLDESNNPAFVDHDQSRRRAGGGDRDAGERAGVGVDPGGSYPRVLVDVSFEGLGHNGQAANQLVKDLVDGFPALRPLALLLKQVISLAEIMSVYDKRRSWR